jgi:hypothetical protein
VHPNKPVFVPRLSDEAESVRACLLGKFPELSFIVWELRSFNSFANLMLARDYILVEVEKMLADLVFETLRQELPYQMLYKPTEKELELYAADPTVVVLPLSTEAPVRENDATLEKMLVDLFANKLIGWIISPSENNLIYEEALSRYQINFSAMLRYARRRNKEAIVKEFIERNRHD